MNKISDLVLRPVRERYDAEVDLGPKLFFLKSKVYKRTDYQIRNKRKFQLQCSYFEPMGVQTRIPCVIYCHGNSGSRIDSFEIVENILPLDMSVFIFDFAGSGLSEGDIVSLGYYEQDDIESVVDFLIQLKVTKNISLWGRSMGAVSALLYASKHQDQITCLILDSPFFNLEQVVIDIVKNTSWIPNFVANFVYSKVRQSVLKKAKFDLENINTKQASQACELPALFIHGTKDILVNISHSYQLMEYYNGQKSLLEIEGGSHNTPRPEWVYKRIIKFLETHLSFSYSFIQQMNTETENENSFFQDQNKKSTLNLSHLEVMSPQMPQKGNKIQEDLLNQNKNPQSYQQNVQIFHNLNNQKEQFRYEKHSIMPNENIIFFNKEEDQEDNLNVSKSEFCLTERDQQLPKFGVKNILLKDQKNINSAIPMQIKIEKMNLLQAEDRILKELEEDFSEFKQEQSQLTNKVINNQKIRVQSPSDQKANVTAQRTTEQSVCKLGPQKYFKYDSPVSKILLESTIEKERTQIPTISVKLINNDQQVLKAQNEVKPVSRREKFKKHQEVIIQNQNQVNNSSFQQPQQNQIQQVSQNAKLRLNCIQPLQSIKPVSVLPSQPKENKNKSVNEINILLQNEMNNDQKLQLQKAQQNKNNQIYNQRETQENKSIQQQKQSQKMFNAKRK